MHKLDYMLFVRQYKKYLCMTLFVLLAFLQKIIKQPRTRSRPRNANFQDRHLLALWP